MQIFKAELKSWMLGEFAPLKSKHDSGVVKANQQNLLNIIANAVKQSFLHCHCEPKARQSFQLHNNRLPRRYAPRNDIGRSMIEMLGVLAIIGVLSVGGLAGYSKAMSKWQENKQLEQISMLLYNTLDTMDYFSQEVKSGKSGEGVPILAAIDRIPTGLNVDGNFVYDTYGNRFFIYYGIGTCRQADGSLGPCKLNMQSYIAIRLKQNGSSFALTSETQCHSIIKAASAFQEYLESLLILNSNSENGSDVSKVIYGKQRCQKSSNLCFNNITPVQTDAFCKSCTTETCELVLYLVVR